MGLPRSAISPRLPSLTVGVLLLAAAFGSAVADAAVVVMTNETETTVAFTIAAPEGTPRPYRLAPGDMLSIPVEGCVAIGYDRNGGQVQDLLFPNTIYYFFHKDRLDLVERSFLTPAERESARQKKTLGPSERERLESVLEIPVMILVDDDEPAVQRVWEARFRKRLDAASGIFERTCRIRFKVVAVGEWRSDNALTDFADSLREFERVVQPSPPARLAIGFTSQYNLRQRGRAHLGGTRGPLCPRVLVREWSQHISESERLEVLVHELGHVFGASHSADPHSVMREVVGDQQSHAKEFRIGFDPLNTLAMYLFCEQLRLRDARSIRQFEPSTREFLCRVYAELGKELPRDDAAEHYMRLLGGAFCPGPAVEPAANPAAPPTPAAGNSPSLVTATASVVSAVTRAAQRNRAYQKAPSRSSGVTALDGDRLMDYYVRVAAMTAGGGDSPPDVAVKAFLMGMAIAVDDSTALGSQPGVGPIVRRIESDAQRQQRLAVLGEPTMRGRRDLARHFVLSAALVTLVGRKGAETVSFAKEVADSRGGSGFSFVDISANESGILFAERLLTKRLPLSEVANRFTVADYVPEREEGVEGLSSTDFADRYGSVEDLRFQKEIGKIRRRILALPGFVDRRTE